MKVRERERVFLQVGLWHRQWLGNKKNRLSLIQIKSSDVNER